MHGKPVPNILFESFNIPILHLSNCYCLFCKLIDQMYLSFIQKKPKTFDSYWSRLIGIKIKYMIILFPYEGFFFPSFHGNPTFKLQKSKKSNSETVPGSYWSIWIKKNFKKSHILHLMEGKSIGCNKTEWTNSINPGTKKMAKRVRNDVSVTHRDDRLGMSRWLYVLIYDV